MVEYGLRHTVLKNSNVGLGSAVSTRHTFNQSYKPQPNPQKIYIRLNIDPIMTNNICSHREYIGVFFMFAVNVATVSRRVKRNRDAMKTFIEKMCNHKNGIVDLSQVNEYIPSFVLTDITCQLF